MSKSVIIGDLFQIFKKSVAAVLPENLIKKNVKYNRLSEQLNICGENYNLRSKNVYVVGSGKAVGNMALEMENILGDKIKQGILSVPEGSQNKNGRKITCCEGAKNNLPDKSAENTSKTILNLVRSLSKEDLLVVLISGGGSALLPLPKSPISLEEKTELIKLLANSGADIKELNTVRKRLSDIKGGKLAMNAYPATVVTLILSDIVGDPIDLIASGPTVENEDSPAKALSVINKYNILDKLPKTIKKVLVETEEPKPFPKHNVKNHVIGSNKLSIATAVSVAKQLKYIPINLSNKVTGNVKDIAEEYAKLTELFCKFLDGELNTDDFKLCAQSLNIPGMETDIVQIEDDGRHTGLCLILGGEITVEVKGLGKGGRNQQLALEFSKNIHNLKNRLKGFDIYFLSAGTDGIDGPTNAAGAIGHIELITDSMKQNLNVDHYLENNDSYNFYKDFNNGNLHVITGHTGTNVMDIHLIIIKCNETSKL